MSTKEKRLAYYRAYNAARKDKSRAWWLANKARKRVLHRLWCQKNRDKRRASAMRYRLTHLELSRARVREYHEANKERLRLAAKERYLKNRDRQLAIRKAYHKRRYPLVRDKILIQTAEYAKTHPEVLKRSRKNYSIRHPEVRRHHSQLRRARVKQARVESPALIRAWIRDLKSKATCICAYCNKEIPTFGAHIDHIVPLTRGGKHEVSNLCPACISCNSSKNNKLLSEWKRAA